jgi:alpha-tubulin suppressor-like RCC1 family protein
MSDVDHCGECGNGCVEGFTSSCIAGECVGDFASVVTGSNHSCVLFRSSGQVYCWGHNERAQLGHNESAPWIAAPADVKVPGDAGPETLRGAIAISAGDEHACALVGGQGNVYCWGDNTSGQLGYGEDGSVTELFPIGRPVRLAGTFARLAGATVIASGSRHSCALQAAAGGGQVLWCWGDNGSGQLGPGGMGVASSASPVEVCAGGSCGFDPARVTALAAGRAHTCALVEPEAAVGELRGERQLWCWGSNVRGQLGDGSFEDRSAPVHVCASSDSGCGDHLSEVREIGAGGDHSCAVVDEVTSEGELSGRSTVSCWGSNDSGELGIGTAAAGDQRSSPEVTTLQSEEGLRDLSLGLQHSCVNLGGSLRCWGEGAGGRLGTGDDVDAPAPSLVIGGDTFGADARFTQIAAGASHTCAVDRGIRAICWGVNTLRQLGTECDLCPGPPPPDPSCSPCDNIAPRRVSFTE